MRACIENKPDIVDVVRDAGIQLTQKGKRLWSVCPFHAERTPSFCINPEKQLFYCFGCHEYGDVIHFVMKHRGITFKEALRALGIAQTSSPPLPLQKGRGGGNTEGDKIRRRERDRLMEEYRAWSVRYLNSIGDLICLANRIELLITDAAYLALEGVREVYVMRDFLSHYLVDYLYDNEEAKFRAWKEYGLKDADTSRPGGLYELVENLMSLKSERRLEVIRYMLQENKIVWKWNM